MPASTIGSAELPITIAKWIRIDVGGAVTLLAGAKVTTADGERSIDRDVTFYVDDPIPFSAIDGIKLNEARTGGIVQLASGSRGLILERARVGLLAMYCPATDEWQVHCRLPLADAISALSHRCAHE